MVLSAAKQSLPEAEQFGRTLTGELTCFPGIPFDCS